MLVNSEKVKPSFRVMSGDTIEVPIGLSSRNEKTESYKFEALSKAEENIIRDTLIYEDEYLLAINKPCGYINPKKLYKNISTSARLVSKSKDIFHANNILLKKGFRTELDYEIKTHTLSIASNNKG